MDLFARTALVAALTCVGSSSSRADGESEREAKQTKIDSTKERREKLADRIKSVQRKVFIKKNRLELYPHLALSVNDAFFQSVVLGGAVGYHLSDAFSMEARAGGVIAQADSNVIRFVRTETDSLLADPPEFQYHADLDFLWAPIYGKLSIFGDSILHFDTYLTVGGGVFGTDIGAAGAANVGLGQRYFINKWLTARIEYRMYLFAEERAGASELQTPGFIGFSVSGFIPPTFSYEYE